MRAASKRKAKPGSAYLEGIKQLKHSMIRESDNDIRAEVRNVGLEDTTSVSPVGINIPNRAGEILGEAQTDYTLRQNLFVELDSEDLSDEEQEDEAHCSDTTETNKNKLFRITTVNDPPGYEEGRSAFTRVRPETFPTHVKAPNLTNKRVPLNNSPIAFAAISYLANICVKEPALGAQLLNLRKVFEAFRKVHTRHHLNSQPRRFNVKELEKEVMRAEMATRNKRSGCLVFSLCDDE